jgi:putative redox protein
MECTVRWMGQEGMSFVAETGSGHLVAMDGSPEAGGRNLAPRPMEMVLLGAGGCTAFDVVLILKRGRHAVSRCDVHLAAERSANDPKVFTRIEMRYTVRGNGLKRAAVERAVSLSHEKYCSASAMLAHTAAITWTLDVLDDEPAAS